MKTLLLFLLLTVNCLGMNALVSDPVKRISPPQPYPRMFLIYARYVWLPLIYR